MTTFLPESILKRLSPEERRDLSVRKDKLRQRINRDVEAFLANGGQIQEVPTGVSGQPMENLDKEGMRHLLRQRTYARRTLMNEESER